MSALRSHPVLLSWLLPFFLFLLTAPAVADSITMGSATYIGWGSWGNPSKTTLTLQLDTRGLIFDRYIPGLQYPLAFNVNVYGWMGRVETNPPTSILIDPPYFCPCETIVFTMSLIDTLPFRLANGQLFTPNSTITVAPRAVARTALRAAGTDREHRPDLAADTHPRTSIIVIVWKRPAGNRRGGVPKAPRVAPTKRNNSECVPLTRVYVLQDSRSHL